MASKRSAQSPGGSGGPPSKKSVTLNPPVNLGPISTEEELDIKVLQIQNKKLSQRLEERRTQEEEWKGQIADLKRSQQNDKNIISALNLAWNQLDEDVCILLQRFQNVAEADQEEMSDTTVAFLEKLSNRTTKVVDEEARMRVSYTGKMTSKLVRAIEKSINQSQNLNKLLKKRKEQVLRKAASSSEDDGHKSESSHSGRSGTPVGSAEVGEHDNDDGFDISAIELAIKQENSQLKSENKRLHDLTTSLHERHNLMSAEFSELHDNLATSQKELNDMNTKVQDTEYDLQKANHQIEKLIAKLNEMQQELRSGGGSSSTSLAGGKDQMDAIKADEIAEEKELARTRLTELENLQKAHVFLAEEYEKVKVQLNNVPDETIMNSTKFKMLQTQYNLLFTDATTIRKSCEEARRIVMSNRNQHLQQIEQLEGENATMRKRVRAEVGQLEKALTESRKELELLRVEYEHNMKAHEQIGPMAKEMRHLINSLQNHNQQLKGEVQRYKRKLTDSQTRLANLEEVKKTEGGESPIDYTDKLMDTPDGSPKSESSQSSGEGADTDDCKVLRTKLKAAREKRKEMKLLLDMYKGVSKETRDKAELLKNEKKLKDELAAQRAKMTAFTKDLAKQSRRLADEESARKIRKLEEKIEDLHKQIANTKQEENALLAEMEFTGQAFEEMQEQNIRLMQQLREKDDANLKLMSERIKANQIQKLLREEKEVLQDKVATMTTRHKAVEDVVKCLEERERVLQAALTNMEKENGLRQQAVECHKRKAIEVGQQCQELMFKLENASKQLEELKVSVIEKANRVEEESFKCNRVQEENVGLKKKLDRAKKIEFLGASDEILVEEVKMYKARLTCPCCNTRPKDAILTKCFHVFCFECLKTRYDTRQRKCPKCNATFGNNDFHKLYM